MNDWNEVASFYFEVDRESKECANCKSTGCNDETRRIYDSWPNWSNNLTQIEVDALWEHGHLEAVFQEKPTYHQVNSWQSQASLGHGSINRMICVKARAENHRVYGLCPACDGRRYIFTAPKANLALVLWVLHPRKGASRGVKISNIMQAEIGDVVSFLHQARKRNADKFAKIPGSPVAREGVDHGKS